MSMPASSKPKVPSSGLPAARADEATSVNRLGHTIGLSQRQVQRATLEQRLAIHEVAFKAIPTEEARLTFRKELK